MKFFGEKQKKLYTEFISQYIPNNIAVYVEPFAGTFSVACYLLEEREEDSPQKFIYNDINRYDLTIFADKIHHLDYKEILKMYDSENTFFYFDPPYFKKEFLYDGCENYTKQFHIELKEEVEKLKGNFLISYYNDSFITNLYKDFNVIKYNGDNKTFKSEILIKL